MIRQTISCDICKTEKKQSNHWFVAYEQGMELRLSGWSSRYRMRPGSKHLCGQTCLHKLVDDFMARALKLPAESESAAPARVRAAADASLTSHAAYIELDSARLVRPEPAAALVAMAEKPAPIEEEPHYGSRNWRAKAWERERQREQRKNNTRPDLVARHGL